MTDSYEDILHLPHHVSPSRRQMSMIDRAAQFSPFAALTGHDAAIRETARLTDDRIFLDVDAVAMLDEKIRYLSEHLQDDPRITVTYFIPDERKNGGAYATATGSPVKIDSLREYLALSDGSCLSFSQIYDISGEVFQDLP